jgi:RNA polymerase sigma-70 factor, ECF subfamily
VLVTIGPISLHQSVPSRWDELSVRELIERAQQDDRDALGALVRRVQKLVYLTLHQLAPDRDDVADLAQEALLKMCRNIKSLRNPDTFKVWLNRILTNLYYDELRKQARRQPVISMDAAGWGDGDETAPTLDVPDERYMPERVVMTAELQHHIRHCMGQLPEQFRLIVVLRDVQGLTYEEIAELTGVTLGTVKSRLARARAKLQQMILPFVQA